MSGQIDTTKFLKLVAVNDNEPSFSWDRFSKPSELIQYLVENLALDPTVLDSVSSLSVGDNRPELDTIWFNTGDTPFIGIPIGGDFVKFYRYPINSPFVLIDQEQVTGGVTQLAEEDRIAYGLPELNSPAFWAILEITT